METIGNIHVVQNRYSLDKAGEKRQRLHRQRYAELRDSRYGSRVSREDRFILTCPRPEDTIKQIDKRFKEGDVLALFTGDGGFHDVVNGIHLFASQPGLKKARLLVLDGGFANDGALQLNSRRALSRPSTILDRGKTIDFSPQAWRFDTDAGSEVRLANLYGTIGRSALVAAAVSKARNRAEAGDSWLKKFLITRQAAQEAAPFKLETPGREGPHETYDFGMANGSRMAGFGGAFPVRLEESDSYHFELNSPGYLVSGVKLAAGMIKGERVSAPYTLRLPYGGAVQLDGEAAVFADETAITISRSREEFTVFSS